MRIPQRLTLDEIQQAFRDIQNSLGWLATTGAINLHGRDLLNVGPGTTFIGQDVTVPAKTLSKTMVEEAGLPGDFVDNLRDQIRDDLAAGADIISATQFARSIRPVEVVDTLPAFGNPGRICFLTTDQKLYRDTGTAWEPLVADIEPGSIEAGDFSSGVKPVEIVSSLPEAGTQGRVVFLTTNNKIYRDTGSAWTVVVPTADLTGTIQTAQLHALCVTSDKLAANSVIVGKVSAGAIGATEIAANSITGGHIQATQVDAGHIVANCITAGQIAAGAIGVDQLAANAVTTGKIYVGAVTSAKIGNGEVAEVNIAPLAVVEGKLAALAISAGKIQANAIETAKIKADTIIVSHLQVGVITDSPDPSSYPFTSFTQDGNWHDLDLSGIVPTGYRTVVARFRGLPATTGYTGFWLRENGISNEINASWAQGAGTTAWVMEDMLVRMDANRKIEYRASTSPNNWTTINLLIGAWMP